MVKDQIESLRGLDIELQMRQTGANVHRVSQLRMLIIGLIDECRMCSSCCDPESGCDYFRDQLRSIIERSSSSR